MAEEGGGEEVDHGLGGHGVGLVLSHVEGQVLVLDSGWWVTTAETPVGHTFEEDRGEHSLLGILNVLGTGPVVFGDAGHTHEAVLGATNGEGGHVVVVDRLAIVVVDGAIGTQHGGTHQHLSLDVSVVLCVVLRHNTTERVTGNNDVVTGETHVLETAQSTSKVASNVYWCGGVRDEVRNTNIDALASSFTGGLNSLSDSSVAGVIALSAVNPNNSDLVTCATGRGSQKDGVASGSGGSQYGEGG